jgi:hypothetical protein
MHEKIVHNANSSNYFRMFVFNCCRKTATEAEEIERVRSVRLQKYELINAVLPVFIAANISSLADVIIEKISQEHECSEIVLFLLYFLFCFVSGKLVVLILATERTEQHTSNLANKAIVLLRTSINKYGFGEFFRDVVTENAAFSFKDFFVFVILNVAYSDKGLGIGFLCWASLLITCLLTLSISRAIYRVLNFQEDYIREALLFECDSLALAVAFILNVLIVYMVNSTGLPLLSQSNYLFSWKDDYSYSSSTLSPFYYPYCLMVALCTAIIQLVVFGPENDPTATDEGDVFAHFIQTCMGYFAGVTYFVLVISLYTSEGLEETFLAIVMVCIFVTWRVPHCLATSHKKNGELKEALKGKALAAGLTDSEGQNHYKEAVISDIHTGSGNNIVGQLHSTGSAVASSIESPSSQHPNIAVGSTDDDEQQMPADTDENAAQNILVKLYRKIQYYYSVLNLQRRVVTMASIRSVTLIRKRGVCFVRFYY